ncbi:unnamed protein product [Thelazia callipaeda]|uniref:4-hydroxyphenylpyruvate dioxygenase n=1 Tax=Thelazia callipaeda TaxID=103827 RepID=A0A0N5D466_THECL|nr:unnamed protein product [Thelazia callipaeda]
MQSLAPSKRLLTIHHIEFYVSNALQKISIKKNHCNIYFNIIKASYWYCMNFGFRRFAIKENEQWRSIAIRNGNIVFIFTTCKEYDEDFVKHIATHGDSIKNIAFVVDDINATVEQIVGAGGFLEKPVEIISDEYGSIKVTMIDSPECDVSHSLLDPKTYNGFFLPKFESFGDSSELLETLYDYCKDFQKKLCFITIFNLKCSENLMPNFRQEISITSIDHFVMGFPMNSSHSASAFYHRIFDLQEIWSADGSIFNSNSSAMKISLLANNTKTIQIGLVEPIPKTLRVRSQIQEFLDYNSGAGVQHVAFLVEDITETAERMKYRGVKFVDIPYEYYEDLQERLANSSVKITESFEKGFGDGNVKALYSAVEKSQEKRGTLIKEL